MYERSRERDPHVDVFLSLEPEALAAKLLFLAKERQSAQSMFYPSSFENEIWEADTPAAKLPPEPANGDRAGLLGGMGLVGVSKPDRPCA